MKEIKKEFRWFFITEYEKEAEYLRQRHKEGWKFKNVIFPGIYTFEKCEPQDVIYQLDYNPEMMSRIFQGRIIPLIGIFAILLYNLYRNISDPAWTIIFGVLTGLYIVVFLQFAIKYISFRNRILKQ